METAVTKRGQTVIPAQIRKRHKIHKGDKLFWIDDDAIIRIVPVLAAPIAALEGSAKGERLLERLLEERTRERQRER